MPGCTNCPSDSVLQGDAVDPVFRRVLWIALVINGGMFVVEIICKPPWRFHVPAGRCSRFFR